MGEAVGRAEVNKPVEVGFGGWGRIGGVAGGGGKGGGGFVSSTIG